MVSLFAHWWFRLRGIFILDVSRTEVLFTQVSRFNYKKSRKAGNSLKKYALFTSIKKIVLWTYTEHFSFALGFTYCWVFWILWTAFQVLFGLSIQLLPLFCWVTCRCMWRFDCGLYQSLQTYFFVPWLIRKSENSTFQPYMYM